jgi:ABC-type multidrug transport system fused ATPase/permease subunit
MLLLTLAGTVASVTVGYLSARIAAGLGKDLRRRLFVRVADFSNTEFDKFSTASLITRSTNDITQIMMVMVMLSHSFTRLSSALGIIRYWMRTDDGGLSPRLSARC